jgi:cytochrome o ubiquinol oxidase subunit 2
MSERNKKRLSPGWATVFIVMGLIDLGLLIRRFLLGQNVTLFNSQGLIADKQHNLFILVTVILCLAAVPVVLVLYFVAWKFRESNTKAAHTPEAKQRGKLFVFSIWAYPILIFFIMTGILIPATRHLEPRRALDNEGKPLTIQVIALRWKWVFLYPEQGVATVNYVALPEDKPVKFLMTADEAPMSSFWIPNLSGQLYAMTGHSNPLNIMATTVGDFPGRTAEINGAGFASMDFTASVKAPSDFDSWVASLQQMNSKLDTDTYNQALKPSENAPQTFYGGFQPGLYDTVLMKYMGHDMGHTHGSEE